MGCGSSGGGSTTTKQEPWEGIQPYLLQAYDRAGRLVQGGSLNPILTAPTPRARKTAFADYLGLQPKRIASQLTGLGLSPDLATNIVQGVKLGGIAPFNPVELDAHKRIIDLATGSGRGQLSPLARDAGAKLRRMWNNVPPAYREAQDLLRSSYDQPWMSQAAGIVQGNLDNPYYGEAAGFARQAGSSPYFAEAAAILRAAQDSPLFAEAAAQARRAGDTSLLDEAAAAIRAQMNPGLGPAEEATRRTVEGTYLTPDSNPYLTDWYQAAVRPIEENFSTSVLPGVTGQFAEAGRYGGGAHQYATTQAGQDFEREMGDLAAQFYGRAYQQERELQEQATSRLAQMGQFRDNLALNAATALGGVGEAKGGLLNQNAGILANIGSQQLGARQAAGMGLAGVGDSESAARARAAGLLANIGQAQQGGALAGAGLLGQLGQTRGNFMQSAATGLADIENSIANRKLSALGMVPQWEQLKLATAAQQMNFLNQMAGVGTAQRDLAQRYLGLPSQAALEPWQRLDLFTSALSGTPGANLFNTQTPYFTNPVAGGLGAGLGGAGLGYMLGAGGSVGGPAGAAIGGGLGLLTGLFL